LKVKGSFAKLMAPGLRQAFHKAVFVKGPPFHIYPGAVIPVDTIDAFFFVDANGVYSVIKPLPPGVPLDEDIIDSLLQHWKWMEEAKSRLNERISNPKSGSYTTIMHESFTSLCEDFSNKIERHYMEALWRQIKRKKDQSFSGT
jgi:hypothetical protein